MNVLTRAISGWGRYPTQSCHLIRPEKYRQLHHQHTPSIARGNGRSYGDASLNEDNEVILTERLNRFLAFDDTQGILTAEAGVTLAEILDVIVPRGWFLGVTPGTQFATLGGCVAADVHGKNHHRDGSFANFVLAFELITANKQKITCSPNQNSEIFWATLGGMGLTGIIGTVTLQLHKIDNPYMRIRHRCANNLNKVFYLLGDARMDDHYSVAWIDCLSSGANLGRSVVMMGHHAPANSITKKTIIAMPKTRSIPFDVPGILFNRSTIRWFNERYYQKQSQKTAPFFSHYQEFFYPLDSIHHWNRLYGKKGFVQYQCALPEANAFNGIKKLLEKISSRGSASFLAVLKRFGAGNTAPLSFAMPGYTLALDIPLRSKKVFKLLDELDDVVAAHNGRIYLAKDARMKAEHLAKMYPRYQEWLATKKRIDPNNVFNSSLSRRLMPE